MYAVRADSHPPGRPVARLAPEHPAMDRHEALDDAEWVDDLDLSLEPIVPVAPRRRRSSPLLAALVGAAFLTMLALGALGAVVLGGAVAAVAFLLFVPRLAVPAELPVVAEPAPIEIVAPVVVEAPVAPGKPVAKPAKPAGDADPAPGEVEGTMVIMPDPGFKTKPVDEAIKKLHDRAGRGEIGASAGR